MLRQTSVRHVVVKHKQGFIAILSNQGVQLRLNLAKNTNTDKINSQKVLRLTSSRPVIVHNEQGFVGIKIVIERARATPPRGKNTNKDNITIPMCHV